MCAGCAALGLKRCTLRQFTNVTSRAGINLLCDSCCSMASKISATSPAVSCRRKDIHSSFSFNSLLFCGNSALHRITHRVSNNCRRTKLCSLHLHIDHITRVVRIGRCLCSRIGLSAHLDKRGRFSCMGPHGHTIRVRVRRTYAKRLGTVNKFVNNRDHLISFSRRQFRCRTSMVVPIHGHTHAITSTIGSTLSRGTSFGCGIVIVSGRSASNAARVLTRVTGTSFHLVRIIPRHASLNVNNY